MPVPVELVARCWFPDNRKRDASNLAKMLGDSLSGIVLEDDSQIHIETYQRMGIDKANPRVEITVTPVRQP
jgi:Holliday junction resolvase RusA-like endonuclease